MTDNDTDAEVCNRLAIAEPAAAQAEPCGCQSAQDAPASPCAATCQADAPLNRRASVDRRSGLDRRRGPGRRRSEDRRSAEEGEMTDEQFEFILAVDQYKRINHRPFPTWTEVLDVVKALGYRKVAEPGKLQ